MRIDSVKLRKFRERHKLSQTEFAESIGLSQGTICEWEKKDVEIKMDYFLKIVQVYGEEANEISKETTTININQNHNKMGDNSIVGFDLHIDAYQLQKEQIEILKEDNEFFKKNITMLFDKMTDLINKIK